MKGYLKSVVPLGLVVSLFLLGATTWLSYRGVAEQIETADWVTHTHIVLERLETLSAGLVKAESARRGFVLTQENVFSEEFSSARAAMQKATGELRTLTADNASQQKRLDQLEPVLAERLRLLEQSIDSLQARKSSTHEQFDLTTASLALKRRIAAIVDEMESAEKDLLGRRNAEARTSAERLKIILLGGTLVSFALLLGVFAVLNREVAERERMEGAARLSEQRLSLASDAGQLGLWELDLVKDTAYRNLKHDQIFGYHSPQPQWSFEIFLNHVVPEDSDLVKQRFEEAYTAGKLKMECRILWPDKSIHAISAQGRVFHDNKGEPARMMGSVIDITEQKAAEEKIRQLNRALEQRAKESEGVFRQLLESAPDAIVQVDSAGRILLLNAQTEKLFGYSREQLLGQPLEILLPERHRVAHVHHRAGYAVEPLTRTMGGGLALHGRRKDGTEFPVDISLSPLHTDQGILVTSIVRDVTDRKQAEEEIKALNQSLEQRVKERTAELEATNKELEAFTYSVSHDLRAPLRHVDGFSRLLLEEHGEQLDSEGKRLLERVRQGTQHMGALVDDLLNLSRVSRREVNPLVTDLNTILEEVLAELKPTCQGRQVEFRAGRLPFAQCDPGLIRQVFANLLSNAVKFTRPRERAVIEVGQAEHDGHEAVFVRDNGVGFSMKYSDKLFGVFQRLHRAEDFEGTGVGLVTVQRIIQKHGGRVWVEAEIDKGATFYFSLEGLEDGRNSSSGIEKVERITKG